ARDPPAITQPAVEHSRRPVEIGRDARHLGLVRGPERHDALHDALENEGAANRAPMDPLPELPTGNVGLTARVARPEAPLRALAREVLEDRVGLPEHEPIVL